MKRFVPAIFALLTLAACGGGGEQQAFEDQQSRIVRLRNLADARCMCQMNDATDKRCSFDYDDERKGLTVTSMPPLDFAVTTRGSCFAELGGQCATEGYYLRGGDPDETICSQSEAIAVNDLYEKTIMQNGRIAADAAAKKRIEEIRAAWRAR